MRCVPSNKARPWLDTDNDWCRMDVARVGDAAMEQALVYEKLPRDIAERHVLLLDPMLGCGSSAVKAIEVQQGAWNITTAL
jgi:Uracil phosphoribosyltransferase